jgi:polyisoprenoid-binding protein YceI
MAETTVATRNVNGTEYPAVGTYDIDVSHTRLGFAVRHMAVAKVRGEFKEFSGTLELAENPDDSRISVTIQAATVETKNENRDNHLRTNDFFDVDKHPI